MDRTPDALVSEAKLTQPSKVRFAGRTDAESGMVTLSFTPSNDKMLPGGAVDCPRVPPWRLVVPPAWVKMPAGLKLPPEATVRTPAFVKAPLGARLAPFCTMRLPAAVLLVRLTRAFV